MVVIFFVKLFKFQKKNFRGINVLGVQSFLFELVLWIDRIFVVNMGKNMVMVKYIDMLIDIQCSFLNSVDMLMQCLFVFLVFLMEVIDWERFCCFVSWCLIMWLCLFIRGRNVKRVMLEMIIVVRKQMNVVVLFFWGLLFLVVFFVGLRVGLVGEKVRQDSIWVNGGRILVIFCLVMIVCVYFVLLKLVVKVKVLFCMSLDVKVVMFIIMRRKVKYVLVEVLRKWFVEMVRRVKIVMLRNKVVLI